MQPYWITLKRTAKQWQDDNVSRLAAALAYFTAISIAPLTLLIVVIAGFVWGGQRAAQNELLGYVQSAVGEEGARFVDMVIDNADQPTFGSIAGIIGVITLIWGATNVFTQLQSTLNVIWNVPEEKSGLLQNVKQRFLSFAMVLVIAFILLVSLAMSTVINAAARSVQSALPGGDWIWQLVNFVFSLVVTAALFAAIFKVLPDTEVKWGDVWIGALVTALLFAIGKFLLSFYLANIGSAYGAAGSAIAFLFWVYFSAQTLFLGAEFTQVYGEEFGGERSRRANLAASDSHSAVAEPSR